MGRVSQFVDFINQDNIPTKEEQEVYYFHINLEDEKDKDGRILRKNPIKETRRKYRLWLRQAEKNQQLNR